MDKDVFVRYVDSSKKSFTSYLLPVSGVVGALATAVFPEVASAFAWTDVTTVIGNVGTAVEGASATVWTAGSLMAMAVAGIKIVYKVVFGSLG